MGFLIMNILIKDEDVPVIIESLSNRAAKFKVMAVECNEPDDSDQRNEYLNFARDLNRIADELSAQFSNYRSAHTR